MLTKTQIKIIGYLLGREKPQSIRGIAKDLGKSYTLVYNNIEDLRKKEIIYKENVPPAQIVRLNKYAPVEVFIEAEKRNRDFFLEKYKWGKVFVNDVLDDSNNFFFVLIVFGGYAKGNVTKKSDLDLLVIAPDKKDIEKIENIVKKIYTPVKKHTLVVDQQVFLEMIKKPQEFNVGNEAKKKHIVLYGVEQYCQLIKKGG